MKTRLLKRLRRRAKRDVRLEFDGHHFYITLQGIDEEGDKYKLYYEPNTGNFCYSRWTYSKHTNMIELEKILNHARRDAVLEFVKEMRLRKECEQVYETIKKL